MPKIVFPDEMPVAEARGLLLANIREEQRCPCCGKRAKIDERPMTGGMVRSLLAVRHYFLQNPKVGWLHCPSFLKDQKLNGSNDFGLLRYWGLIEGAKAATQEGSPFTGVYRVTDRGVDFLEGRLQVPAKVRLFARSFYGLTGELVTVQEALGRKFVYEEVVRGYASGSYPERALPDVALTPVTLADSEGLAEPAAEDQDDDSESWYDMMDRE